MAERTVADIRAELTPKSRGEAGVYKALDKRVRSAGAGAGKLDSRTFAARDAALSKALGHDVNARHPGAVTRHPDHAHDGPAHMAKQHPGAVGRPAFENKLAGSVSSQLAKINAHMAAKDAARSKPSAGAHPKSREHAMMHGAKGGTFYINEHGQKTYAKK